MSDLEQLADRIRLRDLVEAYAVHVDGRRPGAVAALFAEDGELLVPTSPQTADESIREVRGRTAIADIIGRPKAYQRSLHVVTGQHVELAGDHASGETRCLAHHIHTDHVDVWGIRYADNYVRNGTDWHFVSRQLHVDLREKRFRVTP